jgi:hypothetical protein
VRSTLKVIGAVCAPATKVLTVAARAAPAHFFQLIIVSPFALLFVSWE